MKRCFTTLAVLLALTLPAAAHAADTRSCAEILAASGGHHGEGPDGHAPSVSDVIFHHVADSTVLSFEAPVGDFHPLDIDFKCLLCQGTGWNGIVPVGSFQIDLTPTKHLFFMWLAALLLIVFCWVGAPKKGATGSPRGIGAALEMMVVFVRDELARKNIPGHANADRYTPYLLTCFFLILFMGLVGLIPYCATATGNIGVTLGLALLTFVLTQAAGIRAAGLGGYLKHLTGGVHWALWPIMVPVEVLGLFTKPFALTIRLFANMVAGHVVIFFLIGLIFLLGVGAAVISVPFAFAIYLLELFVALVQAYVFTILSSLFIGMAVETGHHDHSTPHQETHP